MQSSLEPVSGSSVAARARLVSVNVAQPRTVVWLGQEVTSGIWKLPVTGRVAVRGVNLDGDDQA
ncbi:MAG: hypothetical protein JO318_08175, partial [Chloroflexi bacterium]|nr:hypothetical protein [Chloroflexota bacterium]